MKTMGTGNCGVPAGKTCTIYGKGLEELQGNPVIVTGLAIPSPHSCHGVNICSVRVPESTDYRSYLQCNYDFLDFSSKKKTF